MTSRAGGHVGGAPAVSMLPEGLPDLAATAMLGARIAGHLRKGDAVFFNPALIHAAGENRSEGIQRMANLLQVSSAFGRAMESIAARLSLAPTGPWGDK